MNQSIMWLMKRNGGLGAGRETENIWVRGWSPARSRQRACAGRCLLVTFAIAAFVASGDWPQWRGPQRDGASAETGLLTQWPAAGPPLLWKVAGIGKGYSSLAVSGNRIFAIGDQKEGSFVSARNAGDGALVWSARAGRAGAPGYGGFEGPRATPAVAGELVFATSQWGEIVCLETATGKERWRKDYIKGFGGDRPEWGFAESPLVDGGKVLFTPGGSKGAVVALDQQTGEKLWQSREFTDAAHYASLIAAEIGGVRQYIQLTAGSVAGVGATDGKLLWRVDRRGDTAVIPTPIYHDGFVYVASGYGVGCNLFKVTAADGKFAATQVWANKVMVNHHGGVVRVGDFVYGFSDGKGWTCQNFLTGAAVWQEKGKLGKGSLVYADGHLYLRQEDKPGTVALIAASPTGYAETGRFNPVGASGQASWSHPVVAGGKLYLRDEDVLVCYDVKQP